MRRVFAILALAALGAPQSATAQRVNVAAEGWTLDAGDLRCSLARRVGGSESPLLILSFPPGADEPELLLMRGGLQQVQDLPSTVELVLQPGGRVSAGRVRARRMQGGRAFEVQGLGGSFLDRFAESRSVRFNSGGRTLLDVATPGARRAVAALRSCNDDLLRSWGVDTAARASFRRPAYRIAGAISRADLPRGEWTLSDSGTVVARFRVDSGGNPGGCAIVSSSRSPELDVATCRLIQRRYRYQPALDAQGRPTATTEVATVNWLGQR